MSPATDTLSLTFAALSDPTRRAMLARLVQGEASVNELAAPFKMTLPAVSKHIKVLEKAGLLTKTRHAQQRPCKIDGEQLKQAVDWIEQYRQLWEGRLDRLDAYLQEMHAAELAAAPGSKPAEAPVKSRKRAKKQTPSVPGADKPKRAKRTARKPTPAQETTDDVPLQKQIGFDF